MENICKNCYYAKDSNRYKNITDLNCFFNPPKVLLNPKYGEYKVSDTHITERPHVLENDFCSQFKPKQDLTPTN